jgi:hypothetical protein
MLLENRKRAREELPSAVVGEVALWNVGINYEGRLNLNFLFRELLKEI